MSEENIHVDTLVTEDMDKDELYDYAKYLEYRKEELLNINHSLQQKVEQLENIRKEASEYMEHYIEIEDAPINERIKIEFKEVLNILNKGSESNELQEDSR